MKPWAPVATPGTILPRGKGLTCSRAPSSVPCLSLPASAEWPSLSKAEESKLPPLPKHQRGPDDPSCKVWLLCSPYALRPACVSMALPQALSLAHLGSPKLKDEHNSRPYPRRGIQPQVFCRKRLQLALETSPVTDTGMFGDKPCEGRRKESSRNPAPAGHPAGVNPGTLYPVVLPPKTVGYSTVTGF